VNSDYLPTIKLSYIILSVNLIYGFVFCEVGRSVGLTPICYIEMILTEIEMAGPRNRVITSAVHLEGNISSGSRHFSQNWQFYDQIDVLKGVVISIFALAILVILFREGGQIKWDIAI